LWATALYAGLRRGELQALRVENIDLETDRIYVERSWDAVEGEVSPKSDAGVRVIPLCRRLRSYLEPHLVDRDGLVFGETPTQPFHYARTTARADKAWEDASLKRVTLPECRHSFRTFLDYAGVSEARCDRYLGHANNSVSRRYTHALMSGLADDAKALDEYLTGTTEGRVVPLAATGTDGA
jgi:integrase